ncbi:MAG: PSD1 and planctomycete cytochrome C domain-containing protein, partial [Bacteroidota bacterium]|nr:PSD1 and planctomycete cytochrome C domain-containing protein [Bacteroidota bacterium]
MRFFAKYWYWIAFGLLCVTAALYLTRTMAPESTAQRIPDVVDFNFHIRPILSDRCFKCHGPDANQRKANLRLDTEAGLYQALKDNPDAHVIVNGNPDESELYQRLISGDTSFVMPPPYSNLTVTDFEKQLIEKWIDQGAKYQKHWAFITPQRQEPPDVDDDWVSNDIDRFVLAKMEERNLKPNKLADKERLLKRVSFDLTGLPPSIELQERFLKDDSPGAYEKIVDELLASSHYGEKMAVHWLDVARYADSHGYQDDGLRTMWPWRDWVIHAFNANYSYDKFLTWQLAGDLLPNPNKEMLLATGFNRNHKITQEGGVIDEEYRVEYVTDRTNTFGKTFLALTLECAKCHDHKYDPISQKDYFSTFAFFNQVPEKGLLGDIQLASLADPPRITITDEDVDSILGFINKKQKEPVQVMVMKDSSVVRPTYVLIRGAYDVHGEQVEFDIPEAIYPFDTTRFQKNRLGLAQWLTDKNHPLTARVFV